MTQKLKFVAVLNSEKAKGKKLRLFNNILEMVRKNHDIEVFKTESKESLKNSNTYELMFEIEAFVLDVNKTKRNWMNASPIDIVKAKLITKA